MKYFETLFLEEAREFIAELDVKTRLKLFQNIELAEQTRDNRLLKKLQKGIWEFRTVHAGRQLRLLAFWDKTDNAITLVVATHGFTKKTMKVPDREIERAARMRADYFNSKK
jgi:phage-related protein